MAQAPIDLSAIAAGTATVIFGTDRDDASGYSVASAGDINGDGFDDLLIGAPKGRGKYGESYYGEAYVVFGKAGGLPATIDLSTFGKGSADAGFVLYGSSRQDRVAASVASAGDLNGDGYDDLLIGAPHGVIDGGGDRYSAQTYVYYGKAAGFTSTVDLSRVAAGTGGFVITGVRNNNPQDQFGRSVASAGDINGDGFDDLIVGIPRGHPAGKAVVVFGKAGLSGASLDLAAIEAGDGSVGFVVKGVDSSGQAGISVASAGDINGDGFDDLIIGADLADGNGLSPSGDGKYTAGASYVVYGRSGGFGASLDLARLTTESAGFVIFGADRNDRSGRSVASAGDVNGDGFADLLIGAPRSRGATNDKTQAGEAYVVYGKAGGFSGSLDLGSIVAGTGGFVLYGQGSYDSAGYSVASAGDINGDGLDDILIGAFGADGVGSPGNPNFRGNAGSTYVVFGKAGPFAGGIRLDSIAAGTGGFVIRGADPADFSGSSVASAGDLNGDGFDDLIVGAPGADAAGNAKSGAGESTVIYGRNFTDGPIRLGTAGNNTLTGTAGFDDLIGAQGSDILTGNGGADVLLGASGDDRLRVSDLTFRRVDGGSGIDTFALDGAGITLDLSVVGPMRLRGIERIDLTGSGNNRLILNAVQALALSDTSNALRVDGDARDRVLLAGGGWSKGSTVAGYTTYTNGQANLRIDTDIVTFRTILPSIDLESLANGTGKDGFVVYGRGTFDQSGVSVASAGDINGDGFDDLVIGANFAIGASNFTGEYSEDIAGGEAYVVFGKAGGFGPSLDLLDITRNYGADGFVIRGQYEGDFTGHTVASAGDINGDGFGDLIVTAHGGSPSGGFLLDPLPQAAGRTFVLFGVSGKHGTHFPAQFGLSDVAHGLRNDGAPYRGFVIKGRDGFDRSGFAAASAGDIDGDGFDDLIIGAYGGDGPGNARPGAGETYVVFGKRHTVETGFAPVLNLADIAAGSGGFIIHGRDAGDASGYSVASAGDINGDGLADLLIGAPDADGPSNLRPGAGETYVVFGRATRFGASLDLGTIANGTGGFVIDGRDGSDFTGDRSARSVASAGDLNGDGYDDLVIGASFADAAGNAKRDAGETYVVFGKADGFGARMDLRRVAAGTGGFVINGQNAYDGAGYSVASAGDINGDGIDDLIVGAPYGGGASRLYAGASYIVFGSAAGFGAAIDLGDIADGIGGFIIRGRDQYDNSGASVASIGDINGDGFDDLAIGARNAASVDNLRDGAGETYVVFGRDFTNAVTHAGLAIAETLTGTASANDMVGGQGDDILIGRGGVDVLLGGAGNDTLRVSDLNFRRVDGGGGYDTLALDGAGIRLDLTAIANPRLQGIERIDLTGSGPNSLALTALEVLNLSDTSNTLRIDGNAGDVILLSGEAWQKGGTSGGYTTYTIGQARLEVATAVTWVTQPIDLNAIVAGNGLGGFVITGRDDFDQAGTSVASAGDVNGDGYDDLIIGARNGGGSDGNTVTAGESYVVFGKAGGFGPSISLNAIAAGTGGFALRGADVEDQVGRSVASAGDINGDGFDDLIIGARYGDGATGFSSDSGETYLVFGRADGFYSGINLAALAAGSDGAAAFVLFGADGDDQSGMSVASAGDINGDGLDDLIIGAANGDGPGDQRPEAGDTYVVFGKTTGFGPSLDLADLADGGGTTGFVIHGRDSGDLAGFSVASAGDVNGDGYDDLLIAAADADAAGNAKAGAGETYVVFGKAGGFGASLDLTSIATGVGTKGFVVYGADADDHSGFSVASAGDINGDGFGDIVIGARDADGTGNLKDGAGESYVVFGRATGFGPSLDLNTLATGTGLRGFAVRGIDAGDQAGVSVASAGDINGDGFDDIIIGARYGDGADGSLGSAGETYVVLGRTGGFGPTVNLAAVAAGSGGFIVYGQHTGDVSGQSVASAGDIDGDGFDDLIIGARYGDLGGNYSGQAYVLFGRNFNNAVNQSGTDAPDLLTGSSGDDNLVGGRGDDVLVGKGGIDVLLGGAGNDTIHIGGTAPATILPTNLAFRRVDGGGGFDTLALDGANVILDLTTIANSRIQGIERIDLTGSGNNGLLLSLRDVLTFSDSSNTLRIDGNVGDGIRVTDGDWRSDGVVAGYRTYVSGQARLEIATSVAWTLPAIDLAALPLGAGTVIFGAERDDRSAYSVASAGDINGDGYDDLLIGAANSSGIDNNAQRGGDTYLVFGKAGGLPASIDLSTFGKLSAASGFVLYGTSREDRTGRSVSSAGDINGDGFDDLLIGAPHGNLDGNGETVPGEAYVFYGKASGFAPAVDLGRVAQGTGGFVIQGRAGVSGPPTLFGYSVASAGDINGDGFDDVIVGAPKADAYADGARRSLGGEAMVVFGRAGVAGTRITLADIEAGGGSGGFVIHGAVGSGRAGISVASAGDINGDGFDDLVIGADRVEGLGLNENGVNKASAGATYVVYGKAAGFGARLDLERLAADSTGFAIYGADARDQAGRAVAAAGDINGDGFGDLIVGAPGGNLAGNTRYRTYAGEAYVIYGKAGGFDPSIDLTGIATGTGSTGFVLYGHVSDQAGYSVAAAGDVNGDGFDDVLIGARGAAGDRGSTGATYVVFGKAEPFAPSNNLDDIAAGTGGFIIRGRDRGDRTGTSVAAGGDINGDGFDDLVVGAPGGYAANNAKSSAGETYIIYGRAFSNAVTQLGGSLADTLTGTAGADDMVGGRGNDILIGKGGADILFGGSGNDTITVSDLGFARVDGDGGIDSLALDGAGMTLDLSTIANTRLRGIERIDLTGSGNNILVLTPLEVLNLSDSSNTLTVDGNAGDGVLLQAGAWVRGAIGGGYVRYSAGQAALRVNTAVTVLSATPSVPDLTVGSDTGQSAVDNVTRLATPLLTGSAEGGSTVTLFEGATVVGSGKANASGVWSIKTAVLANGTHDIVASAVSATGRPSLRSGVLTVVIDTIAPISLGAPALDPASDTGVSSGDRITSVTTPLITGQTEANVSVTVFDGLTVLGTVLSDAEGKWVVASKALAAGSHGITARLTDLAGNTGPPSGVLTVVVDTTAPASPSVANMAPTSDSGVSSTDDLTRIVTPVFIGTAEANATVILFDGAVQIGTGKANTAGSWSIQSAALSDGVRQIRTQTMDAAGNVSPLAAALAITIDTVPGAPPVIERATLGTISGSTAPGVTVSLFEGATKIGTALANGSGSWTAPIVLPAGAHAITGIATDPAGNASVATDSVSVQLGTGLDNLLTGGPGADLMGGGAGNDTYLVNDPNDVAGEIAAEGTTDTVIASVSHALAAGSQIEFLRVADGVFDIALTGNALVNTVIGGSGNDTLTGGGAADVLTGGGGADLFVLTVLSDSIAPISGRDRITDFSSLAGDRIDLHFLDANANLFGDQAFTFVGLAGFSGSAGELNYGTGVDSRIQGDVNGDALPDFAILLSGVRSLTASDFVL